jgi:hypothetical protein
MPIERAHVRQQVSVEAKVFAPDLSSCVDCMINDVSPGGALVSLRSDARVPDRIYLWQAQTGTNLECEVRWRKLNLIGLKFMAPESPQVRALIKACLPPAQIIAFVPVRRSA